MIDLTIFKNNLFKAGTEFFYQLGIRLNSNTTSSLGAKELLKEHYKDGDIFNAINETYFLGLVDDSVFDRNAPHLRNDTISLREATGKIDPDYNGLMVFAVKLDDSYSPSRGRIAELTRAFNRASKNIPVVLLLQYGDLLSFATSERTKYKQEWREGEKIGKISLLKNINIGSPHTGHLKILDDLKIALKATDFNALYKQWQEVFDVQLLNKKFYQELANWHFWAVKTVTFPDDVEKDEGVRNATNVIRLITRLIFVWFLKEKGLVHDKLFDRDSLKDILNYSDKTGSTYYKAILQNLFFATLNIEMNKDIPGSRRFVNRQYGIHYFYRYERFFTDKKKALALFENIPFLNGGLFECLDKNVGQDNEIRIDCFTNSPQKSDRLVVPDDLFFSPEQVIDLNEIYGTKGKSYKVKGIINILNSYKFTIAENTPVEEEIALDPELLGKVFENLLASYNPETQTTARKQTGSFYTPREIVNYMVDESLIAYLSSKLTGHNSSSPPLEKGRKGEFEESCESRLRRLLAYSEEPHQFTVQEVDVLINAIDNAKILDPACGSGAFPMGILHKMTHILHKLDPDNEKWKQRQIDKVDELIRSAEKIDDSTSREQIVKDLEATKQNIEDAFEHNDLDYGRKLFLIENCIYGIDIQPIAVQIAKLRFFISLIVDQGIDAERKNMGIRPLPNLETKFVAANTLIGIEKPRFETLGLRNLEIDVKEKELKQVREKHFSARTPQTKDKYRLEDARLRAELAELFKNDGFSAETTHKLAHWDPYDQNASADFFDPEWMFGISDGFDVVIGNPPYIPIESMQQDEKDYYAAHFPQLTRKYDSAAVFILSMLEALAPDGVLVYISSVTWQTGQNYCALREHLFKKHGLRILINLPFDIFKAAYVDTGVYLISKEPTTDYSIYRFPKKSTSIDMSALPLERVSVSLVEPPNYKVVLNPFAVSLIKKATASGRFITLGEITDSTQGLAGSRFPLTQRSAGPDVMSFLCHGQVYRYMMKIEETYNTDMSDKRSLTHYYEAVPRLVVRRVINRQDRLMAALCDERLVFKKDLNPFLITDKHYEPEYLLGILNSRLISYLYVNTSAIATKDDFRQTTLAELRQLPIPRPSHNEGAVLVSNVKKTIRRKHLDANADTTELENKIDVMVYKLYDLTYEEVKIIDPEFEMTEKEYVQLPGR